MCRRCSVTDDCLSWAIESGQDAGVWGGLSEDERRAMRRRRSFRSRSSDARPLTAGRRSGRTISTDGTCTDRLRALAPPACPDRAPVGAARAFRASRRRRACARSAAPAVPSFSGRSPPGSPAPSSATPISRPSPSPARRRAGCARPAPCSTAFCSSSVSTSASGVATVPGQRSRTSRSVAPRRPASRSPRRRRSSPPAGRRSRRRRPTPPCSATASRAPARSTSPGAPTPAAPRCASGTRHPPGLQPQQRGDGLQVVLHPVVDLADGRVLGEQLRLAAAQLGRRRARARARRARRPAAAGWRAAARRRRRARSRPRCGTRRRTARGIAAPAALRRQPPPTPERRAVARRAAAPPPGCRCARAAGRPRRRWGWRS